MLTTCLLVAALAAGVTGAWSPCGLSMVETLAPGGFARTRAESALAAATFTAGALAGGAITFGGLALLGALLGAGGATALGAAAVVAVAAASRGARAADRAADPAPGPGGVAPRAAGGPRRPPATASSSASGSPRSCSPSPSGRSPERASRSAIRHWARRRAGVRTRPRAAVVALAPRAHAATAVMCERPGILLGLRRVDAVALAGGGARAGDRGGVRRPPAPARAKPARLYAGDAYNPTAGAGLLAWQRPGGIALLRRDGADGTLPGRHPALGGSVLAWLDGDAAVIADAATGALRDRLPAPGAQAIGVSEQILAWRAPDVEGRDVLWARALAGSEPVRSRARRAAASSAGPRWPAGW